MDPPFSPDLEAYFTRLGYTGSRAATAETLRELLLRHVMTIPFENLDVLLGKSISLEPAHIERKLVHDRRGGYCYEHNTYWAGILRALGFHVTPLIARVRWQRPPDFATGRTHMILRVQADGRPWLADVGFGSIGITAPLALDVGDEEQPTPHEPRRLVQRGAYTVQQVRLSNVWSDVFEFTADEVPAIDYEIANWWSNKNPRSNFQKNLIVARVGAEGRLLITNREFTVRSADGQADTKPIDTPAALLALLAERFGLVFPVGTRFDAPAAPWPR